MQHNEFDTLGIIAKQNNIHSFNIRFQGIKMIDLQTGGPGNEDSPHHSLLVHYYLLTCGRRKKQKEAN